MTRQTTATIERPVRVVRDELRKRATTALSPAHTSRQMVHEPVASHGREAG